MELAAKQNIIYHMVLKRKTKCNNMAMKLELIRLSHYMISGYI